MVSPANPIAGKFSISSCTSSFYRPPAPMVKVALKTGAVPCKNPPLPQSGILDDNVPSTSAMDVHSGAASAETAATDAVSLPERSLQPRTAPATLERSLPAASVGHASAVEASPSRAPRHVCDWCGKVSGSPSELTRHLRLHTDERPFVCGTCGQAFRDKGNLGKHKRVHTGERPYVCGTCGFAFSQKHCLQDHRRIHTGERPFVCEVCGKAFGRKQHLQYHKRLHTGQNPFACGQCDEAFTQKQALLNHLRGHMSEEKHQ